MAKFIEVQTTDDALTLLNLDKVEFFFINDGGVVCFSVGNMVTEIDDIDWETLKSMLGDSLIQLNKD